MAASLTAYFKPSPAHLDRVVVSFDLFGTLVVVERSADPARTVIAELIAHRAPVPDDWDTAFGESHVDAPFGAEVPLSAYVAEALSSRGIEPAGEAGARGNAVRRAVVATLDPSVQTRQGARNVVRAAAEREPVGVLSNCSVPDFAGRALVRSALDRDPFDAVFPKAGCGWRKLDPRAFQSLARRLDVSPGELVYVGDDSDSDRGIEAVGGRFLDVWGMPLTDLPPRLGPCR